MSAEDAKEESVTLKLLLFQMYSGGYTQDEIAAYVGKSKTTVNTMLRPLQKKKGKEEK
jgi:transposase